MKEDNVKVVSIITPHNFHKMSEKDQRTVTVWLEQNRIDYKHVHRIVLHDAGAATVSRWSTNWRGVRLKINREGEVPFYDTALTTQPSLEGTP